MKNKTSLSELWKSPEWKKISHAYVEGKVCEWCGAHANDTYEDSNGKTRRLGLSPHHIEKHKWGLSLYNQVKNKLFTAWLKENRDHKYEATHALSKRETREYVKGLWSRDNKASISEAFEAEKRVILDAYIHLSPETTVILCSRCHYAREKGLLICPECRKKYRKLKYPTCAECSRKTRSSLK